MTTEPCMATTWGEAGVHAAAGVRAGLAGEEGTVGGVGLEIVTRGSLAHCLVHFLPSAS